MNGLYESQDVKRVRRAISDCVESREWLAVIGDVGVGKTTAVDAALAGMPAVKVIEPLSLDRERLRIGSILEASIRDLSDEEARRTMEARAHQWRRVAGEAAVKGRVVLVLEEAHRLHRQTLSALKRLREIEFARIRPVVAIVLVGQPRLVAMLRQVREVGLRVKRHQMQGLTASEIEGYLAHCGHAVSPKVAAEMGKITREPLALIRLAEQAQEWALGRGSGRITVEDVRQGGAVDIGERIRRCGVSQGELARRTNLSKGTISGIASGKIAAAPETERKVEQELDAIEGGRERGVA